MRSRSGMLVALECRMSSWVMKKIAAAVRDNLCSFLATEVTSMFIRSSRFTLVRSGCVACPGAAWDARNRKNRTDPRIACLPKTRRTAPSLLISLSCRSNTTFFPSRALSARSRWKYSGQHIGRSQGRRGTGCAGFAATLSFDPAIKAEPELLYSVLGGSTPSQAAEKVGFGRCFEGATLGASLTEAFGRGERGAEPGAAHSLAAFARQFPGDRLQQGAVRKSPAGRQLLPADFRELRRRRCLPEYRHQLPDRIPERADSRRGRKAGRAALGQVLRISELLEHDRHCPIARRRRPVSGGWRRGRGGSYRRLSHLPGSAQHGARQAPLPDSSALMGGGGFELREWIAGGDRRRGGSQLPGIAIRATDYRSRQFRCGTRAAELYVGRQSRRGLVETGKTDSASADGCRKPDEPAQRH